MCPPVDSSSSPGDVERCWLLEDPPWGLGWTHPVTWLAVKQLSGGCLLLCSAWLADWGREGEMEGGRERERGRNGKRDRKAEVGRGHSPLGRKVNIGSLNTGDTMLLWLGPTEGLNVSSIYIQIYCRSQHCHLSAQQTDSVARAETFSKGFLSLCSSARWEPLAQGRSPVSLSSTAQRCYLDERW